MKIPQPKSLFDVAIHSWNNAVISLKQESFEYLQEYVSVLSKHYANGRVVLKSFAISFPDNTDGFVKKSIYSYLVKQRIFTTENVIREFGDAIADVDIGYEKLFQDVHPYELPGALAIILQQGGAYSPHIENMKNYELSLKAALELTNGDLNNAIIFHSHTAWSSFFYGVAWDHTFVVYLPAEDTVRILLTTDTD